MAKRPMVLWLPIAVGALNFCLAIVLFGLYVAQGIKLVLQIINVANDPPPDFWDLVGRSLVSFILPFIAEFIFTVSSLSSLIGLMKQKAWARWLLAAINLGVALLFVYALWDIYQPFSPGPPDPRIIIP